MNWLSRQSDGARYGYASYLWRLKKNRMSEPDKETEDSKKTEKKKMKREESVTDCFNDQSIKGGLHV